MGIHLPRIKFSTSLSTVSTLSTNLTIFIPRSRFLYSFSRPTHWRKIWARKEYKSQLTRGRATISENIGLSNSRIFSRFILSFTYSKWTTICPEIEYGMLVWVWASISKHFGLTFFIKFSKPGSLHSFSRPTTWRYIISRKEYRNLAGVRATISNIFYSVIDRLETQLTQLLF